MVPRGIASAVAICNSERGQKKSTSGQRVAVEELVGWRKDGGGRSSNGVAALLVGKGSHD